MSSHSYQDTCPVCGLEMDICTDSKPFTRTGGWCFNCGFEYYTRSNRMPLDEINDNRADQELEPLTKEEYNRHTKKVEEFLEDYS